LAGRSHLSIGEVLSLLQEEFPEVTISKIRFLESQGLVDPERTPSGYRKFYEEDIERLRWVLRQQRDAFLPLKVIKGRLEGQGTLALEELPVSRAEPVLQAALRAAGEGRSGGEGREGAAEDRQGAASEGRSGGGGREGAAEGRQGAASEGRGAASEGRGAAEGRQGAASEGRGAAEGRQGAASEGRGAASEGRGAAEGRQGAASEGRGAAEGRQGAASEGRGAAAAGGESTVGEGRRSGHTSGVARTSANGQPRLPAGEGAGDVGAVAAGATGSHLSEVSGRAGGAASEGGAGPEGRSFRERADKPRASALRRRQGTAPGRREQGTDGRGDELGAGRPGPEEDLPLEELLSTAGVDLETVHDLERYGLIAPRFVAGSPYYTRDAAVVAKLAAAFARHGVEARHLRAYKGAAEREAGVVQQVVMPLIRQRNPEARRAASEAVEDLSELGAQLRAVLLRGALADLR
jgi:DNA-binding transcriptional MerR regulator